MLALVAFCPRPDQRRAVELRRVLRCAHPNALIEALFTGHVHDPDHLPLPVVLDHASEAT